MFTSPHETGLCTYHIRSSKMHLDCGWLNGCSRKIHISFKKPLAEISGYEPDSLLPTGELSVSLNWVFTCHQPYVHTLFDHS